MVAEEAEGRGKHAMALQQEAFGQLHGTAPRWGIFLLGAVVGSGGVCEAREKRTPSGFFRC